MTRFLKDNERLVQIGVTATRAPDGTPNPSVPMYIIVSEKQVNETSGLTSGEESACCDIAGLMASNFARYMRGAQAAERQRKVVVK